MTPPPPASEQPAAGTAAGTAAGRLRYLLLIVAPLALLLALVGVGYHSYVVSREAYLTQSKVRALASVAEQIEGAIDGLSQAVDNAVAEWVRRRGDATACASLDRLLANQIELTGLRRASDPVDPGKREAASGLVARPRLNRLRQTRDRSHYEASAAEEPLIETADAALYFCRRPPQEVRDVAVGFGCAAGASADGERVCAETSLGEIVRRYLRGSTIDHLDTFVINDDGTMLFESGNTGLRLARLRKAPDGGDGKGTPSPTPQAGVLPTLAEVTSATMVRSISVDGTTYRLFSQPMRLQAGSGQPYVTWAIGVLVPEAGVEGEQRLPLSVLAGVPALFLLAAMVLPFVKVATIGPREPLAATTVFGLALALFVGTALVVVSALDWYAYRQLRGRHDQELRTFASTVERNFREELGAAARALATFRDARLADFGGGAGGRARLPEGYAAFTDLLNAEGPRCPGGLECPAASTCDRGEQCLCADGTCRLRSFDWSRYGLLGYPWFSIIALADAAGTQREKWTVAEATTPQVDMKEYSAHRDVVGSPARLIGVGEHPFALNVMMSPNTGQMLTVLSMPIDLGGGVPPGVATMVTDLFSIKDPLVPPDLGFAVIDRTGRVIFHSNLRRQLYENLFVETAGSLPLRSALFSAQADLVDIEYHGQPHRALVQPLADSGLALIVFRDKDLLRIANAELVLAVAVCSGALLAALVLWVALARWLLGRGVLAALWPDPRTTPRYRLLVVPQILLLAWTLAAVGHADAMLAEVAVALAALTALSVVLLVLAIGVGGTVRRWAVGFVILGLLFSLGVWISLLLEGAALTLWLAVAATSFVVVTGWEPTWLLAPVGTDRDTTSAYVTVAVLLVVQLGALPPVAFFRDAFAMQIEAAARTRQLRLADGDAAKWRELAGALERRLRANRLSGEAVAGAVTQIGRWARPGAAALAPDPGQKTSASAGQPTATLLPWLAGRLGETCRDEALRATACTGPWGRPHDNDPVSDWCRLLRRGTAALLLTDLPIFTQESLWLRHAYARHASDCSWELGEGLALQVQPDWAGMGPIAVPAWQVSLAWPPSPLALGALALAGLLWLVLLGSLAAWVVHQVSHPDLDARPPDDDAVLTGVGDYHVRPSPATLARLRAGAGQWIDLDAVATSAALATAVNPVRPGRVVLARVERALEDAAWQAATLALLEDLVIRQGRAVDVVTDVDLLSHFAAAHAGDAARWARLLARLDKCRYDLAAAPLPPRTGEPALLYAECRWTPRLRGIRAAILDDARWTALSPEGLLELIGDLAEAYYRTLWSQLTDQERLVLYHLAATGFVNPRNRAVAGRLMQRRLIRRAPALQLMNESFRRFVREVEDRATIRGWERAAGASAWTWVRNAVLAVIVAGAVFLFLTQPESYAKWAALLTAVTTVGGGLAKLLGLFQSRAAAGAG